MAQVPEQTERKTSPSSRSGISRSKIDASGDIGKKRPQSALQSYLRVFSYADRQSWILNIITFFAAIGAGAMLPLMDLIFGKFVTTFVSFSTGAITPAQYRSEVNKYTLYFLYLFVAKFLLFYTHSVLISIAAIRTTKALRIDFVKHTLSQNIAYFDSEAGSVSSQITTSSNNVSSSISEKLSLTIQGVSTFVTAFIIAFAVQWKLTLITISIVPTIIIAVSACLGFVTKWEDQMLDIYGQAGKLAEEVFSTMRTVHGFWLNPLLSRKFDELLIDARAIGMKNSPVYAVLFSTEFFCIYSAYGLAFWRGIRMYASGEISQPGQVFTVILAVIVAATAMSTIAPQIITLGKGASAAATLFQVIDRPSEIDSLSNDGHIPEKCIGRVEIDGIHFTYPTRPDVAVLNNFSLTIPANSTTALVGASGSGKSTIVGLLERWYDSNEGSILLDGVKIQDLNLGWLRTNIRLVQQEPVLFSGTVFENVACGLFGTEKGDLPEEHQRKLVEEACKSAYADEFVEQLPKGYDTQIGERAIMLSGGQKQRLAIARSIISDPQVLLLDEATSALDPKAEKMVQQALDSVSRNRTTIVIAHKLSTIKNADNIAVMSNGSVIEQGTHDELLERKGAYAGLVSAQDLGQADKTEEAIAQEQDGEKPTLVRTQTHVTSMHSPAAARTGKDGINYNLISCIFIVFWEHRRLWPCFLILVATSLMGGATYPTQAVLFSRIARAFEIPAAEAVDQGDFYSLMFFIVAIGNLVAYSLMGWFSNIVVQHVSRGYRLEIFDLILKQDMNFFDREENATGALVSNLSSHPNSLLELLGFNVMLIFINVISVLSSCILALAVGWRLGCAIAFGALPLVVFSGYLRIRLEFKLEEQTGKRFGSSAALASEAVSAIRTVSSLALERHVLARYEDRLQGVARHSMKSLIWTMFWYSLTQSISFLAMALGFWYGGQLISRGEYTTTQFYTVFIAVVFSGEAAASFFSYTTSMTKAATAANYIFWLRRQKPAVQEESTKPPFDDDNEKDPIHMQMDNVDFAYESRPNAHVLKNIDVDVQPGQFIAFVGASGCGKSTTIALFERFYDPISGCIKCDGSSLPDLCPRKYRSHVSLVQQEPVLYQGTVRDNIAMGIDGEATGEQIEDVAKQSNIYNFVSSLPEGFNTLCGSRGTQLSGGQRQRIAIARALIRQPRLLLLDEATSALDTESEKIVQAALEKAKRGRTTIAVAHRLSTIKDADMIVVFSRGRIAEVGTHKELLGRRGMYFEMSLGQSLDRSIPSA
ncbi:multidrug resistance protein-like protein 1 [Bimuria novae-zelandiae CBS 107.79]|uniref:Multidrug resistance protein-like protein 1 n=1 Tax=Bimuria novae-zelandiae CBS 107.79 TaxID=1447943 RepID=A0A6A5VIW7_9PLEO|nr:multidrug resistance protein-like protein 1 [Bimuria novae-zelandiae CBS 107.79]